MGVGLEMFSLEGWDRVDGWGWRGYNHVEYFCMCIVCTWYVSRYVYKIVNGHLRNQFIAGTYRIIY